MHMMITLYHFNNLHCIKQKEQKGKLYLSICSTLLAPQGHSHGPHPACDSTNPGGTQSHCLLMLL